MAIKRKVVAWALLTLGAICMVAGGALIAIPLGFIVAGILLIGIGAFAVDVDDAE